MQPTCSKGAIPTAQWQIKASDPHRTALRGGHRGLDALRRFRPGNGDKGCDAPRLQGVTLARGQQQAESCQGLGKGKSPALLTGRPGRGLGELRFPPQVRRQGLSHPPYRVAPVSGQPKEHNGKMPTTANTQPCAQGGGPAQRQPQHLQGASAMPRSPFAQRAARAPSSPPRSLLPRRRSALELEIAAASPPHTCLAGPTASASGRQRAQPSEAPAPQGSRHPTAPQRHPHATTLRTPHSCPKASNFSLTHLLDVRQSPTPC